MADVWADYAYPGVDLSKYAGVMRYLPFVGSKRTDLTAKEVAAHHAAGRSVGLAWEKSTSDALGTTADGATAAKAANAAADTLGAPTDVAIFYAVDSDLTPAQVAAYFTGVQSAQGRPVGIYGSARICDWARTVGIRWRWQSAAWSAGVVSTAAHLLQSRFLPGVDENDPLSPFPAWGPKGTTPMPDYQHLLDIAYGEIGTREGIDSAGNWNNDQKYSKELPGFAWSNYQPWCDTFVAWCFWKAGLTSALDTVPGNAAIEAQSAGVAVSYQAWLDAGRFTEYPTKGAQVIYGKDKHTGICLDWDGTYVWAIEGNTNDSGSAEGNGVYLKKRLRTDAYVTGYGVPLFPDGVIISADPKWHHPDPIVRPDPQGDTTMPDFSDADKAFLNNLKDDLLYRLFTGYASSGMFGSGDASHQGLQLQKDGIRWPVSTPAQSAAAATDGSAPDVDDARQYSLEKTLRAVFAGSKPTDDIAPH